MRKSKLYELAEVIICFSVVGLLIELWVFVATTKLGLTENTSRGLVGVVGLAVLIASGVFEVFMMLRETQKEARRFDYTVYNRRLP